MYPTTMPSTIATRMLTAAGSRFFMESPPLCHAGLDGHVRGSCYRSPSARAAMDRILTLHFIDGSKLSFDFPEQTSSAAARQLKIADLLTSKHVVIEAEGTVMLFPVSNIKYLSF